MIFVKETACTVKTNHRSFLDVELPDPTQSVPSTVVHEERERESGCPTGSSSCASTLHFLVRSLGGQEIDTGYSK